MRHRDRSQQALKNMKMIYGIFVNLTIMFECNKFIFFNWYAVS